MIKPMMVIFLLLSQKDASNVEEKYVAAQKAKHFTDNKVPSNLSNDSKEKHVASTFVDLASGDIEGAEANKRKGSF